MNLKCKSIQERLTLQHYYQQAQSQAYGSSENITLTLPTNLCPVYVEFAFSLFCSFLPLTHQTNTANPDWLKCCKLYSKIFTLNSVQEERKKKKKQKGAGGRNKRKRKKFCIFVILLLSRQDRILNMLFQQSVIKEDSFSLWPYWSIVELSIYIMYALT